MANFEMVLHGVPYGHQSTKTTLLRHDYFQNFYRTRKSGEQFYLDKNAGNGITVYTFCLYPNQESGQIFTDANGRSGSYVGLSLVVDSGFQFPDTQWLLNKIRESYYKYIHNKLVTQPSKALRWAKDTEYVLSSSGAEKIIHTMENWINSCYIEKFLTPNKQSVTDSNTQTNTESETASIKAATEKLKQEIANLETQLAEKRQQLTQLQQDAQK